MGRRFGYLIVCVLLALPFHARADDARLELCTNELAQMKAIASDAIFKARVCIQQRETAYAEVDQLKHEDRSDAWQAILLITAAFTVGIGAGLVLGMRL